MSEVNIDMEVIARWEPTGFIDGLPVWEKEELAIIYDNSIRLILSDRFMGRLPKEDFELFETCLMPVIRRLYRRIGGNFKLEHMMGQLLGEIKESKDYLKSQPTPEDNPIVSFSVQFADNYEDELTSRQQLTNEEYEQEVDKMLKYLRQVLLNEKMVTNVDKNENEWVIGFNDFIGKT
jgi:hypothetical protein